MATGATPRVLGVADLCRSTSTIAGAGMGIFAQKEVKKGDLLLYFGKTPKCMPRDPRWTLTVGFTDGSVKDEAYFVAPSFTRESYYRAMV